MASDVLTTVVNRLNGGPGAQGYADLGNGSAFVQLSPDGTNPSLVIFGQWEATPVDIAYGGTNATTAPQALINLGALPIAGGTMTGNLILNANPTTALGAVTKQYADAISSGLDVKTPCYAGTTGSNLNAIYNNGASGVGATLTNAGADAAFSIDGTTPALNARILVKDQTSTFQNGIYSLTTVGTALVPWVLTRTTDYDIPSQIFPGNFVLITAGTSNAGTGWIQTSTVTTIGTDPITFSIFGNPGTVTSVSGTALQIDVANGTTTPVISIDAGYVGQDSITNVGTIDRGTWQGNTVDVLYGGTGISSATPYSIICGGSTLDDNFQSVDISTATAGDVLTFTSSTSLPTWQTPTGPSWIDQTTTSVTMAVDTNYVTDNAGLVTLTLPATAAFGSTFQVTGKGAGGWKIAQNAGQQINFGNAPTTVGVTGYLSSTNQFDSVTFVCVTANTEFVVYSSIGNITVN
jgi:hypothetical protein